SEGDAIVDLADLVQCLGPVLGNEQDAVGVIEHDNGPTPSDALSGIVRSILHLLLWGNVERHAHRRAPDFWRKGLSKWRSWSIGPLSPACDEPVDQLGCLLITETLHAVLGRSQNHRK